MKLSNKLLIVLMLITLLLLFIIPANADYDAINPIADAHIYSSSPDNNYGSSSLLYVGSSYKSLIKFDLSQYQNKEIAYARLKIKVSGGSNYADANILFYRVTEPWNESDVTWNNAPSYDNSSIVANISISSVGTWYEVDLTDEVQYLVNNIDENHGWILVWDSDLNGYVTIVSREGSNSPTLEIYYVDGSSTTVTTTVTSTTTETTTQTTTVTETQANATITQTITTTITQPATTYTTTIYSTKTVTQPSTVDTSSAMSLISSLLPMLLLIGIIGAMAKAVSRG